jgi:hypothetical protein
MTVSPHLHHLVTQIWSQMAKQRQIHHPDWEIQRHDQRINVHQKPQWPKTNIPTNHHNKRQTSEVQEELTNQVNKDNKIAPHEEYMVTQTTSQVLLLMAILKMIAMIADNTIIICQKQKWKNPTDDVANKMHLTMHHQHQQQNIDVVRSSQEFLKGINRLLVEKSEMKTKTKKVIKTFSDTLNKHYCGLVPKIHTLSQLNSAILRFNSSKNQSAHDNKH